MAQIQIGDPAPKFSLRDVDDLLVALSDYAGRRLIIYFYPAAMTPGCTIEAKEFTQSKEEFAQAGFDVVGISPDSVEKIKKFRDRDDLTVRLLSDPDRQVIDAYQVWGVKKLYGKDVEGVIRSTFVVDVDEEGIGVIKDIQRNVRSRGHVGRLGKSLGIKLAI